MTAVIQFITVADYLANQMRHSALALVTVMVLVELTKIAATICAWKMNSVQQLVVPKGLFVQSGVVPT